MPEGSFDNPPPKEPGKVRRAIEVVKHSFPWDKTGNKMRSMRLSPEAEKVLRHMADSVANRSGTTEEKVLRQKREALQHIVSKHKVNTLPDLEHNIIASEIFIRELRNSALYKQDPEEPIL